MADTYGELAAEVDRIVNSPYPTALKALHDISRRCSSADVSKWARSCPCQIDSLVVSLLDGLQEWPYVVNILTKLSCAVAVRNAVLKHAPTLLHSLTVRALKTENSGVCRYGEAAVALLSFPLPDDVSLPSMVQTLFVRMVEHARRQTSVSSVKPLYILLKGIQLPLLALMSDNVLSQFEDQLLGILRTSTSPTTNMADDQCLILYCLAIMKIVVSSKNDELQSAETNIFYNTQELLASSQPASLRWNPEGMRKFFNGPTQAHKTLRLLVLRAMEACSASTNAASDDLLDTLGLASEIIDAVPWELRAEWCRSNAALRNRLQQKALAMEGGPQLRLQALTFVSKLHDTAAVTDAICQLLTAPRTLVESFHSGQQAVLTNMGFNCLNVGGRVTLVRNILVYLLEGHSLEILEGAGVLGEALSQLTLLCIGDEATSEAFSSELSAASFAGSLQKLMNKMQSNSSAEDHFRAGACRAAVCNAYSSVVHSLSSLLLKCALYKGSTGSSLSPSRSEVLLGLHSVSAALPLHCRHRQTKNPTSNFLLDILEQERTLDYERLDWKEAVQEILASRVAADGKAIDSVVSRACADLEARCDHVEQPLREERERRIEMQERYESLCKAHSELEAEVMDRDLHSEALKAEKDQLISELDVGRLEADQMAQGMRDLATRLRESNAHEERELAKMKNAREIADLEHAAAFAKTQEQLEEGETRLEAALATCNNKQSELQSVREEMKCAREEVRAAKAEKEALERSLKEEYAAMHSLETESHSLSLRMGELESTLQSAKNDLALEKDAHMQDLEQVQEQAKQKMEAATSSHSASLDRLEERHGEKISGLEQQLSLLRNEMQKLNAKHDEELSAHANRTSKVQKKIDRLQTKLKQKDEQIAEANIMRSNLMAAMGFAGLHAQQSLAHRTRSSTAQTQNADVHMDTSPSTPSTTGDVQNALEGASFVSNVSCAHSQSGPTPKRAKPRKSFKIPSPANPRLSTSRKAVQGWSVRRRQPLSSLNVNRSPQRAGQKTPSRPSGKGAFEDVDGSTFEGSELFDGTQGERLINVDGMLNDL